MEQTPEPSSRLDSILKVVATAAAVAVPLAVAWSGNAINRSIQAEELKAEYVAIAVNVLSRSAVAVEGAEREADLALRSWAVEVLTSNSPVPVRDSVADPLRLGVVELGSASDSLAGTRSFLGLELRPLYESASVAEGCRVFVFETAADLLPPEFGGRLGARVFAMPSVSAAVVNHLPVGVYAATEYAFEESSFGGGRSWFKVEGGWVSLAEALPLDCQP